VSSRQEHVVGPLPREEFSDASGIARVELVTRWHDQPLVSLARQAPDERRADQAAVADDDDPT